MLAELGRLPLQISFWQQILHYHNQVRALPNSWLDTVALIDDFGDDVVATAYISTHTALVKIVNIDSREDRIRLMCVSGSVEDKHHFAFDRPTYSHIRQQHSHLFHQASPSVAAFLATNQAKATQAIPGSYLKSCRVQRQCVLASPLLAWLLNFVQLG